MVAYQLSSPEQKGGRRLVWQEFTEARLLEHLLRSVRLDPRGWGSTLDLKITDKLNESSAFVL